jgi:hypothetical protein
MTKSKQRFLALTILTLTSACAGGTETSCLWVKAIRPSHQDVLTKGTKQQIVTHNETLEKNSK